MASTTLLRPSLKHRSVYVSGSRSRMQSREIMEQSAIKAGILSPKKPFVPQTLKFGVLPTISEHGAPDLPRASDLPVFGSELVLFSIKQQQDTVQRALSLFCFASSRNRPKSIVMDYVRVNYKTTFSEVYNQMHFALCKSLHLFATDMNDRRTIPTPGPATMVLDIEGRTVREITESSWPLDKVTLAQGHARLAIVFPAVKAKRADYVSLGELVQKVRQRFVQAVGLQVRDAQSAIKGVELALGSKIYKRTMQMAEKKASTAKVEAIQTGKKPTILAPESTQSTPVSEKVLTRTAPVELENMATATEKESATEEPTKAPRPSEDSMWEPTVAWWLGEEEEKPQVGRKSRFKEVGVDWPYGPYL